MSQAAIAKQLGLPGITEAVAAEGFYVVLLMIGEVQRERHGQQNGNDIENPNLLCPRGQGTIHGICP